MNKLLTLFFVAVSTVMFSQNKTEYHKISLKDKNDKASVFNFYVENVYDGRQFKENIGTVQKGGFNRKVLADFEKPLTEEFFDYLAVICPKQENKSKISIRINDLYVSELTRAMSETGYATLMIDVIESKGGIEYIVGTYSASTESNGMDVTNKHDERLKKVLQECFTNYIKTSDNDKASIVFSADQNIKSKTITAISPKGIYLTYADVLNDMPLDDSDFEIVNKNERFYLLNKTTNSEVLNYYGFSDGKIFYINVSKYASAKYYAKTEIIGNKYYIENVVYNPNNAIAMGAMFGLIGVAIASSAANSSSVPMLIDCYSGQPSFLSNNEMKVMLVPYPTLLKDFKSSKKSSEDIKAILKRYYQETVVQ
ncbi:DUF6563 family protein [Flavobacterium sp. GB2R13]|uniref:DUF6563 family protein n=1 Tax=Flavobacterium algoris TaxID=3398733 RepID=UPI003A88E05C